ncbi:MAG TPA: cysteine hydrolase family protein [Bacilli bacterium]|nr:cysteine hydrolase family protein [Bacilli bacterium]
MDKKLLVVIDYQNDFVTGALGFSDAKDVEATIVKLLEEFTANGDDIVFTKDTHFANYLETQEGRNLPIIHCIKGTPGHDVHGKPAEYVKDAKKVYEKIAFGSLEFANDISKENYSEIVLVGLVTNICIVSQAVLAKTALPEALIKVYKSGVNSYDKKLHRETLNVLEGLQVTVI